MLSDDDLELLEAYLDDELSATDVQRVTVRLSEDAAWASALGEIRSQRALRAMVWQGLPPQEADAQRLAGRVIREARRRRFWLTSARVGRLVGGAAACLLVGAGVGWTLHRPQAPAPTAEPQVAVIGPSTADPSNVTNASFNRVTAPQLPPGTYQVALTDEKGNVLAVQKFDKPEEAQQFAQDLGQVVERQKQVQTGKALLVSDHF